MKRKLIALLTAGHIVTDINQGALPALLPFFMASHNMSYAAAASLVFAANVSSSIIQPLFGYFSDKIAVPWIMPLGILLAGAGLAMTGLTSNYWVIFTAVAISGIGVAAFHPEGARLANIAAGAKKGTGVSMFTAGGNIGLATGPLLAILALTVLGLKGTLVLLLPVGVVAAMFMAYSGKIRECQKSAAVMVDGNSVQESENNTQNDGGDMEAAASGQPKDSWGSFGRLTGAITCRSIIFFGLNTFLPLYFINVFRQNKTASGTSLTILLLSGVISTIVAGRMADKYGQRNVVRFGFAVLIPALLIFAAVQNVRLATFMLVPVGLALFTPFSPMVVLGQKYLPNHMGLASGVTYGLAVSIGGVFAPLLGVIADNYGVQRVIELLTILPVIALIIAFLLPLPGVGKPISTNIQIPE